MEEQIFINVTEEERYMYTYVSFLLFLLFWVGGKKNDSNLKSGKIPCIFMMLK